MQKFSTIILSDEFSTSEVLKLFIEEFDNLELLESSTDLSEISDKVLSTKNKSIVIVDLSTNKKSKLDLILRLTKSCKDCKVLALSDNPSVDLIIEIMRAGAKEFVPVPILKNEFFNAVQKLIKEFDEPKKITNVKLSLFFLIKAELAKHH